MTVAHRSCNADLHEGLTDGKYKKTIMNRGGVPDMSTTWEARDDLQQNIYGRVETPYKEDQFGQHISTPNYRPTLPVGPVQI